MSNTALKSAVSSEVSSVIEGEGKPTLADAFSAASAGHSAGFNEVIASAYQTGFKAGKNHAKKFLLGKINKMTPEEMYELAQGK